MPIVQKLSICRDLFAPTSCLLSLLRHCLINPRDSPRVPGSPQSFSRLLHTNTPVLIPFKEASCQGISHQTFSYMPLSHTEINPIAVERAFRALYWRPVCSETRSLPQVKNDLPLFKSQPSCKTQPICAGSPDTARGRFGNWPM